MRDECLAQQGLCFPFPAHLPCDAAEQAEGVGRTELVAVPTLPGKALSRPLLAPLILTRYSVNQGQPRERVAYSKLIRQGLVNRASACVKCPRAEV